MLIDYMFANDIQAGKSDSNHEEAMLTSQQETPKRRGESKRQSSEKALEGSS